MIPMIYLVLDQQSAESVQSIIIACFTILVKQATIHSRIYQNGKKLII